MRVVLNEPLPVEIDDLLARRRRLGLDTYDEVWDGEYHMNAAPNRGHGRLDKLIARLLDPIAEAVGLVSVTQINVGIEHDFRVPDAAYLRSEGDPSQVWIDDVAIVVEVLSPNDETYAKFDHYFAYGVDEIIVADPARKVIEIHVRAGEGFARLDASDWLSVSAGQLSDSIHWP